MLAHRGSNREPEYLSLPRVAEILDVTPRTVRRYVAEGLLPAYRLGGRFIRFKPADVDALLRPIPTAGGRQCS